MQALVHRAGEGELIAGSSSVTIKATADDTAGALYLGEVVAAAGFLGPPLHVHERMHDMFYVLEGMLTVTVGQESLDLEAGSFVCAPPGVAHTFSNRSDRPVRFLNLTTPGGWENYMRDLAATLALGDPSPDAIGEIAARYDFRAV